MQSFLVATTILMLATNEPVPTVFQNEYTVAVEHGQGVYTATLGPGLQLSFFTRKEPGFSDTISIDGKKFTISAVMAPAERAKDTMVDLVLGPEVLKEFIVKVEPFRRRARLVARSGLEDEVRGMTLLEGLKGDLTAKAEKFSLSSFGDFEMLRVLELPACGDQVIDVELVQGYLGFRTGKRLVYRAEEDEITAAGFADLPYQSVVYDFRTGSLYVADPVPSYVPTFFSVVRQPMEYRQGKLYLASLPNSPVVEVHGLPIATYCEFLRVDALRTTFQKGYLSVKAERGPVTRLPVSSE